MGALDAHGQIRMFGGINFKELRDSDPTLVELLLNECNLGKTEALVLANLLSVNTTLKKLNMVSNPDIGPEAGKILADAVMKNKTLEVFSRISILKYKQHRELSKQEKID